jgi:hypothetical protein
MTRVLVMTAAMVAAVVILAVAVAPPHRLQLAASTDGAVPGIVHVHTNRSDGLGSPDEVAAAAAQAGLKFVVFADHGEATRTPDPPTYRSGVLCLDGVEISTNGGHYLAIDMPASPYPLGGEARDVVEDVRRLGGFGIAAHPDSPKVQLQWTDWTAPIDGVEMLNLDTSWRVLVAQPGWTPKRRLLTALLTYPLRAPETMASLIQPTTIVERWARIAAERRLVVLAGADAHAKLATRNADPGDSSFALPLPGYEPSFRVMSVRVQTERPLSGDAGPDAAVLMRAIRNGHLYTAIDGIATPPSFSFTATNALGTVHQGDVLGAGSPVELRIQSNAPPGFTTVVHEGVRTVSLIHDTQDVTVHGPATPGVYWAEIVSTTGSPPVTWIRSNPIYVRGTESAAPKRLPAVAAGGRPLFDGKTTTAWEAEHDVHSLAAIDAAGSGVLTPELRFRFGLAGGTPSDQFVSMAVSVPDGVGTYDAIAFSVRAEKPMRISLQVRDTTADRWQRSIYVDAAQQDKVVPLVDLTPVGVTRQARPSADAIRNVMFVIDLTNTKPGTSGRIWVRNPALVKSAP